MTGVIENEAFVSLATNNGYALGALVLGRSLRSVDTNRRLVLMITNDVHPQVRQELLMIWDRLVVVDVFDSEDAENLELLRRPDLGITFTKLHAWKLTEYRKCVFLDADTLVLRNIDDLFDRPELSAAPDIGWPDCFNSGVFVFVPSLQTYQALVSHALVHGSFDGGDQGLLNSFFNNWSQLDSSHRLSFTYNLHSNVHYTYSPAFRRFRDDVKVVHFLGAKKPWQHSVNLETGQVIGDQDIQQDTTHGNYLQRWWDVYQQMANDVVENETEVPELEHHPQTFHVETNMEGSRFIEPVSEFDLNDDIIITSRDNNESDYSYSPPPPPQSTTITTDSTTESHRLSQLTSRIGNLRFQTLPDDQQDCTEEQLMSRQRMSPGQQRWEYGQIDYRGADCFENILHTLEESLQGSTPLSVLA